MTVPPRQPDSFSQNQNRKELSPAGLPLPFSGSSFDENMLSGRAFLTDALYQRIDFRAARR